MDLLVIALLFLSVPTLFAFWATLALQPGNRLKAQYRFAEAAEAFLRATRYMLPGDKEGRAAALINASLCFTDAGNPAQGIVSAERALQNCPRRLRILALLVAAHGHASTGDPERCEWHLNEALQLAEASKNKPSIALVLTYVAILHWRFGRFDNVRCVTARLAELHPPLTALGRYQEAESLLSEGAFDAALAAFKEAHDTFSKMARGRNAAAMARRQQGIVLLKMAAVLLESGRIEAIGNLLEEAAFLRNDRRIRVLYFATCAWAASARNGGSVDAESRRKLIASSEEEVVNGLKELSSDHVIITECTMLLGYAALARQEFAQALTFFDQCRLSLPYPVEEPRLWWGIAQCRQGLGDVVGYRDALRRAIARGLPTYYAGLARAALEAESRSNVQSESHESGHVFRHVL